MTTNSYIYTRSRSLKKDHDLLIRVYHMKENLPVYVGTQDICLEVRCTIKKTVLQIITREERISVTLSDTILTEV